MVGDEQGVGRRGTSGSFYDSSQVNDVCVCVSFISYNSHHKSWAQGGRIALAPKAPTRGQKTGSGIGAEHP